MKNKNLVLKIIGIILIVASMFIFSATMVVLNAMVSVCEKDLCLLVKSNHMIGILTMSFFVSNIILASFLLVKKK